MSPNVHKRDPSKTLLLLLLLVVVVMVMVGVLVVLVLVLSETSRISECHSDLVTAVDLHSTRTSTTLSPLHFYPPPPLSLSLTLRLFCHPPPPL